MKLFFKLLFLLLVVAASISCEEEVPQETQGEYSHLNRDSLYYIINELYGKQDYKAAEALIEKIRAKDNFDIEYFTIRANIKYNCAKFSESLFAANSALAINPYKSSILFLKSSCFMSLNMQDSSLYYLTKAIDIDSTNAGYIISRARVYAAMKIPVLQLDDIKRLIRLDTNNLVFKSNLYLFYYEHGDTLSAINGYKSTLQKDPTNHVALRSLGFIYQRAGENKIAKSYFQKIIDINPTDAEVFLGMAMILSAEKNKESQACDCLLRSLELGNQEAGKHMFKCDEYFLKKGIIIRSDTIYNTEAKQEKQRTSTTI